MSKKINQLKVGVILSYISTILNFVVSVTYTPVMIRLLGQSEYGLYTLVASFVSYLSLFSLGFTGAYLRYYSRYKSKNDEEGEAKLNGIFLIIFIIMGIIALVSGLILSQFASEIFGSKLSATELSKSKILMEILVLNISLTFPSTIFDSIIGAHEKFIFQRSITILGVIFNPIICLPLLLMGYGSISMVVVTTCITIFKLLLNIIYSFKKIKVRFIFKNLDFKIVKDIATFSFFIFLNMIIDQVNWSLDKFVLGRVDGTNSVGIYGVGATINTVFISLSSVISSVFCPRVNRIVASNKPEKEKDNELTELLIKVGRLQYIVVLFITLGFIFAGQSFVIWWVGAEYSESYYVALLLIAPLAIYLPHSLGIEIRRAKNKHQKASIIMLITAIVNCVISIPLSIKFGAIGAALGTLIGNIINLTWLDIYYTKDIHLDIKKLYLNIFKISMSVFPAIIFAFVGLIKSNLKFDFIWAIIFSLTYFIMLYIFGFNEFEKNNVKKILEKIWRKKNDNYF